MLFRFKDCCSNYACTCRKWIVSISRGGHFNRLCTNTRDRGQERGQAVKAENLEGHAVKGTSEIRKSQGSSKLKGQPDTKSHQSIKGQSTIWVAVKAQIQGQNFWPRSRVLVQSLLEWPPLVCHFNYCNFFSSAQKKDGKDLHMDINLQLNRN